MQTRKVPHQQPIQLKKPVAMQCNVSWFTNSQEYSISNFGVCGFTVQYVVVYDPARQQLLYIHLQGLWFLEDMNRYMYKSIQ